MARVQPAGPRRSQRSSDATARKTQVFFLAIFSSNLDDFFIGASGRTNHWLDFKKRFYDMLQNEEHSFSNGLAASPWHNCRGDTDPYILDLPDSE